MIALLLISDKDLKQLIELLLKRCGVTIVENSNMGFANLVIVDDSFAGAANFIMTLNKLSPKMRIILTSSQPRRNLTWTGDFEFIQKHFKPDEFISLIKSKKEKAEEKATV